MLKCMNNFYKNLKIRMSKIIHKKKKYVTGKIMI